MMTQNTDNTVENKALRPATEKKSRQPLLSLVEDVFGDVPNEEWEKLPDDLASQHDHYLYGTLRKP